MAYWRNALKRAAHEEKPFNLLKTCTTPLLVFVLAWRLGVKPFEDAGATALLALIAYLAVWLVFVALRAVFLVPVALHREQEDLISKLNIDPYEQAIRDETIEKLRAFGPVEMGLLKRIVRIAPIEGRSIRMKLISDTVDMATVDRTLALARECDFVDAMKIGTDYMFSINISYVAALRFILFSEDRY